MEKSVAQSLAGKLLQIKAIKLSPQNPFTWASGMLSPIYCDNRITLSHPEVRQYIKTALGELAKKAFTDFDAISGVATAGIAHGALLADYLSLPFSYVRSKAKAHGRQNKIEGSILPKQRILVVEDLISTGMSSLAAVEAVREAGAEVVGVISIFNYGFPKAIEAFENAQCKFASLSNYPVLLEQAIEMGYVNDSEIDILKSWNEDPVAWRGVMN